MSRPTVAEVTALRAELEEAYARIAELELRLHLKPWTQHLPPLAIPAQRRSDHDVMERSPQ